MLDEGQDQDNASREARSFPRLHKELTELGDQISGLWRHVKGANHIVGTVEPPGLAPGPRPTKGPVAPMLFALDDIHDFKNWLKRIHEGLEAPLKELVPEFYGQMDDELTKKEPSEI